MTTDHWLECPNCGESAFARAEPWWTDSEQENCPDCGHLLRVSVDDWDDPPRAYVVDVWDEHDATGGHAVCIFGSRDGVPREIVTAYVNSLPQDVVVVVGGARGVDTYALEAALARKMSVILIPPRWDYYGKSAGPIRNSWMQHVADRGVGFVDGYYGPTRGTSGSMNMIRQLENAEKPVEVRRVG